MHQNLPLDLEGTLPFTFINVFWLFARMFGFPYYVFDFCLCFWCSFCFFLFLGLFLLVSLVFPFCSKFLSFQVFLFFAQKFWRSYLFSKSFPQLFCFPIVFFDQFFGFQFVVFLVFGSAILVFLDFSVSYSKCLVFVGFCFLLKLFGYFVDNADSWF